MNSNRSISFITALILAICPFSLTLAGGEGIIEERAWTPLFGTKERKAIFNALRAEVQRRHSLEVVFVVNHLKVKNGWAWTQTLPQSKDGISNYEDISALLVKSDAGWRVAELPCTDEDNNLCLGSDDHYFEGLRRRFPSVPSEIFPVSAK